MSKHTSGPWEAQRHGAVVGGPLFDFTNGQARKQIAMACVVPEGVDGEQDANARLIAAAPDLLETLQSASSWMLDQVLTHGRPMPEEYEKARAAIAKATGGSA